MDDDRRRVTELIRHAFRDVSLGNGIGLRQGRGLDNYADTKTLAAYRAEDEKLDWSAIPIKDLNRYNDALSFLDAEGMRFHLPAFLIASLERNGPDVVFYLTFPADGKFELLNAEQRQAVREFLIHRLHTLSEPQLGFEGPRIESALNEYWNV